MEIEPFSKRSTKEISSLQLILISFNSEDRKSQTLKIMDTKLSADKHKFATSSVDVRKGPSQNIRYFARVLSVG